VGELRSSIGCDFPFDSEILLDDILKEMVVFTKPEPGYVGNIYWKKYPETHHLED